METRRRLARPSSRTIRKRAVDQFKIPRSSFPYCSSVTLTELLPLLKARTLRPTPASSKGLFALLPSTNSNPVTV
jgi:hypothetical protein